MACISWTVQGVLGLQRRDLIFSPRYSFSICAHQEPHYLAAGFLSLGAWRFTQSNPYISSTSLASHDEESNPRRGLQTSRKQYNANPSHFVSIN
ncbi:uncharacterized protein RAG0_01802 [Rhynchosporium agropyri]|uniref:Uncharacterized protein n=1 Tax=Rhynchosporium agropyri TaxID=914238 RepID=A0A1E1JYI2_9HELO|nr:uncharacterized protein RAG0_01802 [Rhynchosporium agropyri]